MFKVSVVAMDHNEASVHRPAKEFANDRKRVCEWCQCYSTLKAAECLEKPPTMLWPTSVS